MELDRAEINAQIRGLKNRHTLRDEGNRVGGNDKGRKQALSANLEEVTYRLQVNLSPSGEEHIHVGLVIMGQA